MLCVLLLLCLSLCALTQAEHRRALSTEVLENLVQQQASTIEAMRARLTALDNTVNSLSTQVSKQGQTIGFYADMTLHQPDASYYAVRGSPLKFNYVVTNLGNAYNNVTGIFTAPYSGLYMFHFHFLGRGRATNFGIMKGYRAMTVAVVNSDTEFESAATTSVMQLIHGDEVSAQFLSGDPTIVGGAHAGISFSGVLVHSL